MSIINSILKAFVGDKSEKDVKAIQPLVRHDDVQRQQAAVGRHES